ncbi:transferase 1, rSAM/selenodomain-associated [Aedoeadaptatus ivorii]|uniref:Transferase 1, rSAM/selenodomain-associated n=2 Tax=Aedoeadaptatus ivorii TaxID=54006 RepID=A0A3S4YL27_9FIRM|nr:transferase 1, rSAM/selenodomain-associated [Peptoniphilus ivorii]
MSAFMKKTIIFFARTPALGCGKKRLRRDISDEAACAISRVLYDDILNVLAAYPAELVLYYDGPAPEVAHRSAPQTGTDLGTRMGAALKQETQDGPAILLGSDLIGIDASLLDAAFDALKTHDCVLAPSEDGGYGIIGMRKYIDLFSGIAYSRSDVFDNTVKKARRQDATVGVVDTIRDIDDIYDLVREYTGAPVIREQRQGDVRTFITGDGRALRIATDPGALEGSILPPQTMMPFYHVLEPIPKEMK